MPGGRFHLLDGAHHLIWQTHPDTLREAIGAFLREVEANRR